eukprot:364667-Chlamydomonas_euryale.AAC.8
MHNGMHTSAQRDTQSSMQCLNERYGSAGWLSGLCAGVGLGLASAFCAATLWRYTSRASAQQPERAQGVASVAGNSGRAAAPDHSRTGIGPARHARRGSVGVDGTHEAGEEQYDERRRRGSCSGSSGGGSSSNDVVIPVRPFLAARCCSMQHARVALCVCNHDTGHL